MAIMIFALHGVAPEHRGRYRSTVSRKPSCENHIRCVGSQSEGTIDWRSRGNANRRAHALVAARRRVQQVRRVLGARRPHSKLLRGRCSAILPCFRLVSACCAAQPIGVRECSATSAHGGGCGRHPGRFTWSRYTSDPGRCAPVPSCSSRQHHGSAASSLVGTTSSRQP
jgi:hypothetical protein